MPEPKDQIASMLKELNILPNAAPAPVQNAAPAPGPAKAVVDAVLAPPATTAPTAPTANGAVTTAEAPATTTDPAPTETKSIWDAVIDGPSTQAFTEDEDKIFQQRFGKKASDFIAEYNGQQEALKAKTKAAEDYERFRKSWEAAPVEIRNMFDKAIAGEDWRKYLMETPAFAWEKEAKDQDRGKLIDHYLEGVITAEERKTIAEGDADAALLDREAKAFATASRLFQQDRAQHLSQIEAREAGIRKEQQDLEASVEASFAWTRQRYPALAPELTDDLKAEMLSYKAPFDAVMDKDSRNYLPEATFRLIAAKNLDKILARVEERARTQGRNEGVIAASQNIPATARVAGAAAQTPPPEVPMDSTMSLVQQVNQRVHPGATPKKT